MVNIAHSSDCWTLQGVWSSNTSFLDNLLLTGSSMKGLASVDGEDDIEKASEDLDAVYNEGDDEDDEDDLDDLEDDDEDFDDEDDDELDEFDDDEDFDDEE